MLCLSFCGFFLWDVVVSKSVKSLMTQASEFHRKHQVIVWPQLGDQQPAVKVEWPH